MASNVSEKEARQVAEAARESEWTLPSFGKELFLGNFRIQPVGGPAGVKLFQEIGPAVLQSLRTFLQVGPEQRCREQ